MDGCPRVLSVGLVGPIPKPYQTSYGSAWLSQKGRGNLEPAGAQPAPKGDGEAPSSTPAMALLMEQMGIVYLVLVHHPPTARKGGENHRCLQAVCSLKINN